MRKRFMFVTALLSAMALTASAVPAFTADSGTVIGTVSVAAPPAPCITLSTNTVTFGTLELSDPAAARTPLQSATPNVHFTSCSASPENVFLAASDATAPSGGSWDVPDIGNDNTCTFGPNVYQPYFASSGFGAGRLYNPRDDGTFLSRFIPPFGSGQETDVTFQINMPCRGSVGAGETVSMSFSVLAVLV